MPKLIFTLPNQDQVRFFLPLEFDTVNIGRIPEGNHIILPHRSVSRKHAIIKRKIGGMEMIDLHSTNGSNKNGTPFHYTPLSENETYSLGDVQLILEFTPEEHQHFYAELPIPSYQQTTLLIS